MSEDARFTQLHNFHYGYLGEDWFDDYGDIEVALAEYVEEEERATLVRTVEEADELLDARDFGVIADQLTQYFRPDAWTQDDLRHWIRHVRDSARRRVADPGPRSGRA